MIMPYQDVHANLAALQAVRVQIMTVVRKKLQQRQNQPRLR